MKVIAVMTRAPLAVVTGGGVTAGAGPPSDGPKTRLAPALPDPADRDALQRAMLTDVLAAARAVKGRDPRARAFRPSRHSETLPA